MELNLYKCSDGDDVINKTLTDKFTVNIALKRDINISTPQIILMNGNGAFFNVFNYAEIKDLGRFYFIDSVTSLNNKMESLFLRCDYLETYKADILASNAAFRKQVEPGDYGSIDLENTGRNTIANYNSDTSLVSANTIILSTMGVK